VADRRFSRGPVVKVLAGRFAGYTGTIVDRSKTADCKGMPLEPARPGYCWVTLSIGGRLFTAHLREDELCRIS